MGKIRHLSVAVDEPQRAATIIALLTDGDALPFRARYVEGAWICLWDPERSELVELIPKGYTMRESETGAVFEKCEEPAGPNVTHVQLEAAVSVQRIEEIAKEHGCRSLFRENYGGPLFEIWVEPQFLVELISPEILGVE